MTLTPLQRDSNQSTTASLAQANAALNYLALCIGEKRHSILPYRVIELSLPVF